MLKQSNKFIALVAAFMLGSQVASAQAVQEVEFTSAGTPPTPFQAKRAEAQGKTAEVQPGDPLTGHLHRPAGAGPFPAAVLLHGCEGVKDFQRDWAAYLAEQGIVSLLVDSFSARGQAGQICDKVYREKRSKLASGRVFDAFGALQYLAEQSFVDPDRIVGISWTRESGISLTNNDSASRFFDRKFAASVQFYPECRSTKAGGDFYAPLLILFSGANDWAVLEDCAGLVSNSTGVKPTLQQYQNAYHGFDDPAFEQQTVMEDWENIFKTPPKGVTVAYDQDLAEQARKDVIEFLNDALRQ